MLCLVMMRGGVPPALSGRHRLGVATERSRAGRGAPAATRPPVRPPWLCLDSLHLRGTISAHREIGWFSTNTYSGNFTFFSVLSCALQSCRRGGALSFSIALLSSVLNAVGGSTSGAGTLAFSAAARRARSGGGGSRRPLLLLLVRPPCVVLAAAARLRPLLAGGGAPASADASTR